MAPRHRWNYASSADLDWEISSADLIAVTGLRHAHSFMPAFVFSRGGTLVITFKKVLSAPISFSFLFFFPPFFFFFFVLLLLSKMSDLLVLVEGLCDLHGFP